MNKEVKEAKQKAIEVKFKNRAEIEKSKLELDKSLRNLREQMQKARLEEKKLKLQLAKEVQEEKNKETKERRELKVQIDQEKRLITENKKSILLEKQKIKQEIALEKANQKNEYLKTKTANAQKIANLKSQFAFEKHQHLKHLAEVKAESEVQLAKAREDIEKARNEAIKFKIESEKVLLEKQEALIEQKKDFETKVVDLKSKAERERAKRVEENLRAKEEIRIAEQEAVLKHKVKMLEIKGESARANELALEANSQLKTEVVGARQSLAEAKNQAAKDKLELKVLDLNNEQQIAEMQHKAKPVLSDEYISGVTVEVTTAEFAPDVDETVKGKIIDEVGKTGVKLYERANRDDTRLNITKLKIDERAIESIKFFQQLKESKDLIDVREFAKYISYITDREISRDEFEKYVIQSIVWILRGKTLSFLGGYFKVVKLRGFTFVVFDETLQSSAHSLISLPNTEFTSTLEKMMLEKLNRGGVIQISNNIALTVKDGTIKVLNDLPLLEM